MKIAYVINSLECGGAQSPIPDIVHLIQERGGDVTVFGLEERDGLAIPLLRRAGIPVRLRTGRKKDHINAYLWLKRELKAFKPDVVWTSLTRATLLGQIVARQLKVPTVHWQHSARLKTANAWLLRLFCRETLLWVADSETVARFAKKRLKLGNNILCWPIFRAPPDAPTARLWQKGEIIQIGSLGRLHSVKGYDVLCDALALLRSTKELPPFHMIFAGDGPERIALEERARRLNLPVSFYGHCEKPLDFLSTLHLYLQTSHWEGLCVAAHEAMACALPIITTPAGEIPRSVVPGESGLIVPFNDAGALAAALTSLLRKPACLGEMGVRSRKMVMQRFGPEAFAQYGHAVLDAIPGFNASKNDA
ncbi:lipopolysaccharide glycosyl transferase [Neokomagataea thailandica NBRC 106555]|uniref:Glycosyltransferase n=2 Tax=Neokomagataea TaxID=1223423 RepID=A0A4Y6V6Z6_9PROT|nr:MULTISPECIES: glycosyltransferase [Neokomagataea]QDH24257.1 glycosyltransferase [Neokomagataea tanensis]GBR52973.1 lipopolysaccharide glycosyl transferase [Neokomagataea thailandica NBRC 106555]